MVDPRFVTSDDSDQEGITFIVLIHILLADIQARLCSIVSCFGTHLAQTLIAESVVDDFIGRTMTNSQTFCHLIVSRLTEPSHVRA